MARTDLFPAAGVDGDVRRRSVQSTAMARPLLGLAAGGKGGDEHFLRGRDEIHIEFEELFQLFNQDAIDKSIISAYCM